MNVRARGLLLVVAFANAAAAQLPTGDFRAFTALKASDIGGLTPLMTPSMLHRTLDGIQWALRYAVRDSSDVVSSNVAVSGIFLIGMDASMTVTAGVRELGCGGGCQPEGIVGVGADLRVYEVPSFMNKSSSLTLGVSGNAGYAGLQDDNAYVLGVGAPIAASFETGGREGLRVVPYLTPVFGIGQTDAPCGVPSCDKNGTRWVLGGGIGVWNPFSNFSASIGFSQVFFEDAHPLYGVAVVYGGKR